RREERLLVAHGDLLFDYRTDGDRRQRSLEHVIVVVHLALIAARSRVVQQVLVEVMFVSVGGDDACLDRWTRLVPGLPARAARRPALDAVRRVDAIDETRCARHPTPVL